MLKPPIPCMKPPRAITGVPEAAQIKRVPIAAALNDALQVFNSGRRTLRRLFEQHKGLARRLNSMDGTTAELARARFTSLIAPPIASLWCDGSLLPDAECLERKSQGGGLN